ncbi:coronin binding [Cyclospora cayetanensis]|uniref:arginine--tRNA ligase n=1 Tax=Cyclospora cayetanensis TaxID=88456 RepID=A0A1D3D5E5_9EIME|nr:coronin binding [Cyclospora cayetanensis]
MLVPLTLLQHFTTRRGSHTARRQKRGDEVLTPEQREEKERLIHILAKKLAGPLADEHGNVPTGSARPIAIEVDGPSHFYSSSCKYTAYTKLKHRLLTRMGYKVLHVPYFEWRKLRGQREREEYMRKKLMEEPSEWLDPEDEAFYNQRMGQSGARLPQRPSQQQPLQEQSQLSVETAQQKKILAAEPQEQHRATSEAVLEGPPARSYRAAAETAQRQAAQQALNVFCGGLAAASLYTAAPRRGPLSARRSVAQLNSRHALSSDSCSGTRSCSSVPVHTLQDVCALLERILRKHAARAGGATLPQSFKLQVTPASSAADGFELQANLASLLSCLHYPQQQQQRQAPGTQAETAKALQSPAVSGDSTAAATTPIAAAQREHFSFLSKGTEFAASLWRNSAALRSLCYAAEYTGRGLRDSLLLHLLQRLVADPKRLAVQPAVRANGIRLHLDYFSPNIGKDLHVGHLRSAVVGDCLARLLEFLGVDVHRSCHFGDCGTPVAVCLAGLRVYRQLQQDSRGSPVKRHTASAALLLRRAAEAVVAATPPEWRPAFTKAYAAASTKTDAPDAADATAAEGLAVSDASMEAFVSHMAALDAALRKQQSRDSAANSTVAATTRNTLDWQHLAQETHPESAVDLTATYSLCMHLHTHLPAFAAAAFSALAALVGGERQAVADAKGISQISICRFARQLSLLKLSPQAAEGELLQMPRMKKLMEALATQGLLLTNGSDDGSSSSSTSPLNAGLPQAHPETRSSCLLPHEKRQQQQPEAVALRRQGGSYTYIATDLAALQNRVEAGAGWVLHVTDRRQQDHFRRLFLLGNKILQHKILVTAHQHNHPLVLPTQQTRLPLHWGQQQVVAQPSVPQATPQQRDQVYVQHLGLGLVTDIHGSKLSSREAASGLSKLLEDALQTAEGELRRRYPDTLPHEELKKRAELLSFMQHLAATAFDSSTKESCEFPTAWALSPGFISLPCPSGEPQLTELERRLAAKVASFGLYLYRSAAALDPSILVSFLLDLARNFNQFYETEHQALSKGLELLGVESPAEL